MRDTIQMRISRRKMVALLTGASAAALLGCSDDAVPVDESGPCPVTPEQKKLSNYAEGQELRSDVRDGESGVALELWIQVRVAETCGAVEGARVEIWAANAVGMYSAVRRDGAEGQRFLRGVQRTDAAGFVNFKTIYPGWQQGRASHINLRIESPQQDGTLFTGELFFPPEVNEGLRPIYPENKHSFINNDRDPVFTKFRGRPPIIKLEGSLEAGFAGTAIVSVKI